MSVETIQVQIPAAKEERQPEQAPAKTQSEPKEEFVYEYQPKDSEGRPLGGKQVIKANNMQEALDKMAQQNQELIRLNRKMKQDMALGLQEETGDKIPDDAERIVDEELDFTPKVLTAAERLQLARDVNDPDKVDQVAEKLSEVLFGHKPEKVRQLLKQNMTDAAVMRSHAEASAFREAHPEFYNSPENIKVLIGMMQKEKLRPTKKNFEIVYSRASKAGLLVDAPNVAEETPTETQSGDEQVGRITDEPSQQKRPVRTSSGLRGNGSPAGGTGSTRSKGYSKAEIAKMSAQEYKEKVLLPELRRQQPSRSGF